MAGKNRLMARLVAASTTITPDSDYIATNLTKTQPTAVALDVYSSIDSLPAYAETGTKALVTGNNTLYIYNNGWYKIAIINNFNPQWITQPNSTYDLAINGAATSITVVASDSDDVPITYIATPDSDFLTFATVTHDSDKDNTWIIQPVDSENGAATGGTGTVTFKASDGVNLVQALSTFSLSFGATYSNLLNSTDYALGTTGGTFETSVKKQGTHSFYVVGLGNTVRNPGANSGSAVTYNDWTISFWFNIQSFYNYSGTPHIHLFNSNDKYQGNNNYSFGTKGNLLLGGGANDGTFYLASDVHNGSNQGGMMGNPGAGSWVTGAWYHLVFSGSTTGPTIGAWITREGQSFGNLVSKETFGGGSFGVSRVSALKIGGTTGLYLHGSYGTASDGGNVYYDDFRIYNAKASSSDAQAIFDSAGDVTLNSNPMQSNLKLAYTFDNTANSIS